MSPDGLIRRQGAGISEGRVGERRVGERRGVEPGHDMEIPWWCLRVNQDEVTIYCNLVKKQHCIGMNSMRQAMEKEDVFIQDSWLRWGRCGIQLISTFDSEITHTCDTSYSVMTHKSFRLPGWFKLSHLNAWVMSELVVCAPYVMITFTSSCLHQRRL